jgi:hypothetical protein
VTLTFGEGGRHAVMTTKAATPPRLT